MATRDSVGLEVTGLCICPFVTGLHVTVFGIGKLTSKLPVGSWVAGLDVGLPVTGAVDFMGLPMSGLEDGTLEGL